MRRLGNKQLAALYDLADGNPCDMDELVSGEAISIGEGKNGLPIFSRFQKRFARVGDQIVGYNHNPFPPAMWIVGPGHFSVQNSPDREGEVWINYIDLPTETHPDFPKLCDNNWFPARLVYGGMVDILRRVTDGMYIGKSFRPDGSSGMNDGQYFAITIHGRTSSEPRPALEDAERRSDT